MIAERKVSYTGSCFLVTASPPCAAQAMSTSRASSDNSINDDMQDAASKGHPRTLQTPRAGPGEMGKIWWNTVSGWRGSPEIDSDREREDLADQQSKSTTNDCANQSRQGSDDTPQARGESGDRAAVMHRIGDSPRSSTEVTVASDESKILHSENAQNLNTASRKGTIDFIKERTNKREQDSAESWYRR